MTYLVPSVSPRTLAARGGRRVVSFALLAAVALAPRGSGAAPPARPAQKAPEVGLDLVISGGDLHTVSGAVIPHGTLVIRGERIVALGKDLPVPAGATVIDATGKVVTPGLIETDSAIGLVEISMEAETADNLPRLVDPIRAAVSARDAIDLHGSLPGVARRHGVTSAVSVPSGGLISGRSAWIDLVSPRSRFFDGAVRPEVAMHGGLGAAAAAAAGASRAAAVLRLREVLEDARVFARERGAFTRGQLYDLSTSRLDLAALGAVLTGSIPFVVEVHRAADIVAALELARAERLRLVLIGAEEGWMVADEIAAAKVPVIVEPLSNLPDAFETRNARADNATLLAQAGVKVALSTRSSHLASNLRFYLGNAVRAGLPPALALRAATLTAAEIFGQEKHYGSLEVGKLANVVVWTGDPFEPSSFAQEVVIRGELQPTESRQTRLARRYIERHGLVRPKP